MSQYINWNSANDSLCMMTDQFAEMIIDLLANLQKSLYRALFLYNFIREVRSRGVRAFITIVQIRKFYKCSEVSFH